MQLLNSKAVSNAFTSGTITFPPFPYFDGRFSNGKVSSEILAEALGVPLQAALSNSFAFGGSNAVLALRAPPR